MRFTFQASYWPTVQPAQFVHFCQVITFAGISILVFLCWLEQPHLLPLPDHLIKGCWSSEACQLYSCTLWICHELPLILKEDFRLVDSSSSVIFNINIFCCWFFDDEDDRWNRGGVWSAPCLSVCRLKINLKIFKVLSSGLSLCIFVGLRFEIKSA